MRMFLLKENGKIYFKQSKKYLLEKKKEDAFFPFSDNIERAYKSGVKYRAKPGGSLRDNLVIECCDKYNMTMLFTRIRLFHH